MVDGSGGECAEERRRKWMDGGMARRACRRIGRGDMVSVRVRVDGWMGRWEEGWVR
jgi:hypothetical protein